MITRDTAYCRYMHDIVIKGANVGIYRHIQYNPMEILLFCMHWPPIIYWLSFLVVLVTKLQLNPWACIFYISSYLQQHSFTSITWVFYTNQRLYNFMVNNFDHLHLSPQSLSRCLQDHATPPMVIYLRPSLLVFWETQLAKLRIRLQALHHREYPWR